MKPTLLQDKKFLLLFLRADQYDISRAAKRLAAYFQYKLDLFGDEKLVTRITLKDMNDDDMESMKANSTILVPMKDRAGRRMFFVHLDLFKHKSWQNQVDFSV